MWKSVVGALVAFALAFVVGEFGLAAMGQGSLYQSGVSRLFDPVLLFRLPPHYGPGIDENGYRNPTVQGPFDVVFLGDSHTYGYGATASDSLPRQFERLAGVKAYSFGMGGFGPAQYNALADRALALRPRYLVVASFLGNDLADACVIANRLPYWQQRYRTDGISTANCGDAEPAPVEEAAPSRLDRMKSALKSTRVGSLLNQFAYLPAKAWFTLRVLKEPPVGTLLVDDDRVFSIFNVWGSDRPHAQEGLQVTRPLLANVFDKAIAVGVCPMLVLLPSKEDLLLEYLQAQGYALPAGFVSSVMAERAFARALSDLAVQHGATPIDPRAELLATFDTAGPLYPADLDGHPLAKGYAAYARALQRSLPATPCGTPATTQG